MNQLAMNVELVSFVAVALLGAVIAWRKAGKVLGVSGARPQPRRRPTIATTSTCRRPRSSSRLTRWRDMAGVALAAGIRPCAGALIVLVFALSQGLFAAGIAATFAMALGTALTTGAIAALAVFAKALALRIAGGRGPSGAVAIAGLELLAAAFVLVLGLSLLFGLHPWRRAKALRQSVLPGTGPDARLKTFFVIRPQSPRAPPSERGSCTASTRPLRGCFTSMPAWPKLST